MANVTKPELVTELSERLDITKVKAADILDALFGQGGIIAVNMRAGNTVKISGFGTFTSKHRAARNARNPKTGGVVKVEAKDVPNFRFVKSFKNEF